MFDSDLIQVVKPPVPDLSATIIYGTSDDYLNLAEALLTIWVGNHLGIKPVFFNYPKSGIWRDHEVRLFEPYEYPFAGHEEALLVAGLSRVEIISLHDLLDAERVLFGQETLGQTSILKIVNERIRPNRDRKAFVVANLADGKRVYASSKSDTYVKEISKMTFAELLQDPAIKIGGTLIYFLYGYYLAISGDVGILPGKQNPDVLGAFTAGVEFANYPALIFLTGEFDFMTAKQWILWENDKRWRKAPPFAIKALMESEFRAIVRARLLNNVYCPLVYDEEREKFSFRKT